MIDFETYSEAGYVLREGKWKALQSGKPGIQAVGTHVYAEHPSTRVLSLAYRLPGAPIALWVPGMPPPADLFAYIAAGGLLSAWNSMFEFCIWRAVCTRMGWPPVSLMQFIDPSAASRAFSLPGGLEDCGAVLKIEKQKLTEGKRLIQKFSVPSAKYADPSDDPIDGTLLYQYNMRDVEAEEEITARLPPLIPQELEIWQVDQAINDKGVYIDRAALEGCIALYEREETRLTTELQKLTFGLCLCVDITDKKHPLKHPAVESGSEVEKIRVWCASRGVKLANLDAERVTAALAGTLPDDVRRVLEIRQLLSMSSVSKLYAIRNRLCADGRVRGLFQYCGADRTGRWAGRGPQPQNLPSAGPDVPDWSAEEFLDIVRKGALLPPSYAPPKYADNIIPSISGSLRGLFCAAPGMDFICSDYRAIEAVALACIAGEQWRIDVFKTHGKIYETSASKITGIPFEVFLEHKKQTGEHHPMRKKVGKPAELASGYGGGPAAWKVFGADQFLTDEEIANGVKAWRAASPNIVNFWYRIEDVAKQAVRYPGTTHGYRGIEYTMHGDVLFCKLPSGRTLKYHEPRLTAITNKWGKPAVELSFSGNDGVYGWGRIKTWGGKLTENIVQAICRDILAFALVNLYKAGYMPVLHVHDEPLAEVPEGFGSVEEFEKIGGALPDWCQDWPIILTGGWRGKRYRKD